MTTDQLHLLEVARTRLRIEFAEQAEHLHRDYDNLANRYRHRGMLDSGMFLKAVADSCVSAIDIRAQVTWQTIYRFISSAALRYGEELASDLKRAFRDTLGGACDLFAVYTKAAKILGDDATGAEIGQKLDIALAHGITRIEAEIELLCTSLKAAESAEASIPGTIVNVYSPVGVLQTGSNASSNVNIATNEEAHRAIVEALRLVEASLSQVAELVNANKSEVEEMVRQAKEELQKGNPNGTLLRSLLPNIAIAVQTTGAVKPAYDAMKWALSFLGITVP
jgi:hypothetical protein